MVEKLFFVVKKFCSPIAQDASYLTSVPLFLMLIIELFQEKNHFTKHFNIFVRDV
jgi:hypothetical protein